MKRANEIAPRFRISRAISSTSSFKVQVWCGFSYENPDCTKHMAKIDAFFNLMFEQKASDLHLSSGNNPMLRINGALQRVDHPPLENDDLKTMLYEIAPEYKIKVLEETGDVGF